MWSRPDRAAIELISIHIMKQRETDIAKLYSFQFDAESDANQWLDDIFRSVRGWYRDRFGAMLVESPSDGPLRGFVIIGETPFRIEVPARRHESGSRPDSIRLSFPDRVFPDESATSWLNPPTILTYLSRRDREAATAAIARVAGRLRFIRNGLLGVRLCDGDLASLIDGIMPRLQRASDLVLDGRASGWQAAHWELQMACELALKVLQKQRVGRFIETHDLAALYRSIPAPEPSFDMSLLSRLPGRKEMSDLRYGLGRRRSATESFRCYETALEVVGGSVDVMNRMSVSGVSIEVRRPTWL